MSAIPLTLHYQVRLTLNDTGQAPVNGFFKFALIADETTAVWSSDGTTNLPPVTAVSLTSRGGVFNVSLGDTNVSNMATIPAEAFAADQLAIRVWFSEDNLDFERLRPDRKLGSVAFAVRATRADVADSIPVGVLTESHLPSAFVQQFQEMSAQLVTLSNQLAELSQTQSLAPVASILSGDANLTAQGYGHFLTVPASSWEIGSADGAPAARFGHSAVWTGDEVIVWGGEVSVANFTGTGRRYHPETDAWVELPRLGAPTARSGHTAVWTGTEMVVWGGIGESGFLRTGGRFDLDGQVWREVSRVDAPSERTGHVSVWTGKYFVVFGGRNAGGRLDSTGVYDPVLDTWQRLTLTNAPTARFGARAVWITSEGQNPRMLVWGGRGEGGALNSGAQLIFENGEPVRWETMSTTNAPGARHDHSLVWTGERVFVWGGERNNTPLATGGLYNPFTDTWELFTGQDAPSARAGHSAVWTGKELLVQGGETTAGVTDTGHAVNPADGQWRELDKSVSPIARRDATSLWAGDLVVLFGGHDGNRSAIGALRHLDPQPTVYLYRKQ